MGVACRFIEKTFVVVVVVVVVVLVVVVHAWHIQLGQKPNQSYPQVRVQARTREFRRWVVQDAHKP